MINTSREYKNRIRKSRTFIPRATITLADSTVLTLDKDDIMQNGLRIDDSVGEKIALGTVNINKCTLILNNFKGKFDTYDFTGAVIRPYSGLQLSEAIEYLAKGVFTTNSPNSKNTIVILEALDNMNKFNKEFSGVSISAPCTSLQLLQAVCVYCGVSLATISFLNSNYIVDSLPDDETISCREVVGWIAQNAGCFARFNTQGALELKWYDIAAFESEDNLDGGYFDSSTPYSSGDNADGGNFTDYNSGDNYDGGSFTNMDRYHHLYSFNNSPTIGTDDVIITGIQVTDTSETPTTVLYGSNGYVLTIEGNQLIQNSTQAALIANSVGAKIVGMRIRPFTASTQSDPAMEAGDIGYVSDRKGNSYQTVFTSLSYTIGNYEPVSCGTETPAIRNFRPTQEMKAIVEARKNIQKQITAYDIAQQTFNNLVFHSFGVYRTVEEQPDGSKIEYSHDKPTLAESQNIWKQTAGVFAVSNDGGHTWRGMDAAGNILATVLNAIGVNAEWIKVLSSFTVGNNFSVNSAGILHATNAVLSGQITANSGQIGPFSISNRGLFSRIIEIFEDNNYPLIWLSQYDINNVLLARANYEPSSVLLSNYEDNETTTLSLMVRDNTQGNKGHIIMEKYGNGGSFELRLTDEGYYMFDSRQGSGAERFMSWDAQGMSFGIGDYSANLVLDPYDGTLYINAIKVNINGTEF